MSSEYMQYDIINQSMNIDENTIPSNTSFANFGCCGVKNGDSVAITCPQNYFISNIGLSYDNGGITGFSMSCSDMYGDNSNSNNIGQSVSDTITCNSGINVLSLNSGDLINGISSYTCLNKSVNNVSYGNTGGSPHIFSCANNGVFTSVDAHYDGSHISF